MSNGNTANVVTGLLVLAALGCNGAIPGEADKKKSTAAGSTLPGATAPVSSAKGPTVKTPGSTGTATGTGTQPGTTAPTSSASVGIQQLFGLINASRAKLGLPPLVLDQVLSQCGQRHVAATYAAANGVYQAFPTAAHIAWKQGDTCQGEGGATNENQAVGLGKTVQESVISVHDGMMNEGPPAPGCSNHYSAITNPTFTRVGIGLTVGPDGAVWVSEEFR